MQATAASGDEPAATFMGVVGHKSTQPLYNTAQVEALFDDSAPEDQPTNNTHPPAVSAPVSTPPPAGKPSAPAAAPVGISSPVVALSPSPSPLKGINFTKLLLMPALPAAPVLHIETPAPLMPFPTLFSNVPGRAASRIAAEDASNATRAAAPVTSHLATKGASNATQVAPPAAPLVAAEDTKNATAAAAPAEFAAAEFSGASQPGDANATVPQIVGETLLKSNATGPIGTVTAAEASGPGPTIVGDTLDKSSTSDAGTPAAGQTAGAVATQVCFRSLPCFKCCMQVWLPRHTVTWQALLIGGIESSTCAGMGCMRTVANGRKRRMCVQLGPSAWL